MGTLLSSIKSSAIGAKIHLIGFLAEVSVEDHVLTVTQRLTNYV